MTLQEQMQKWLEDHNGKLPEIIAFNNEDAETAKKVGELKLGIKVMTNPYVEKGSMLFIAEDTLSKMIEDAYSQQFGEMKLPYL